MVFPFLVLLAVLLSSAMRVLSDAEKGFADNCRFQLEGQSFNLCPIFEKRDGGWTIEFERQTPPTITRTEYKIALHGPLRQDTTLPKDKQCPDGTWLCMKVYNTRPDHDSEPPRLLQAVPVSGALTDVPDTAGQYRPGLNVTKTLGPTIEDQKHRVLHVRMHGGYYVDQLQSADFQFFCDHAAEEPTSPTYYWSWRGLHAFKWTTKYACGSTATITKTVEATYTAPVNEEPPRDEEDEHSGLSDDELRNRRRGPTWKIFLSSTCLVFIAFYLLYWPPRILRRRLALFLKARPSLHRFRVGERVLVRWAQEDVGMIDFEEDVMVNGGHEAVGIGAEEQIPLTPSPRKSGFMNYGSA